MVAAMLDRLSTVAVWIVFIAYWMLLWALTLSGTYLLWRDVIT